MATLEKIRSKSVFLLIIIGAALLAFIIGDFFTSGRTLFGTGTTVAKVDGTSIDIQEFQRRLDQAGQQAQASGQKVDQAVLQQQVLDGMIAQKLYDEEVEALGLTVTDSELSEVMLGSGAAMLDGMIRQQTGIESAAMLHDMAFNPAKYQIESEQAQQLQQYWLGLEKQTEEQLLMQKFQNLFAGTLVANELDAKALYDENAATSKVAYVNKAYSTLADTDPKFAVTDDEVAKEWNAHKSRYAISEELRDINYISVDIVPSEADVLAAEKRVEEALAALNEKPDLEGVAEMADFVSEHVTVAASAIRDKRLRQFADSTSAGRAALISRMANDFTLAKMFSRANKVDSVNIDLVVVQGNGTQIDSVLNLLNSGSSIADVRKMECVSGVQDSLWISMIDNSVESVKNAVLNASLGSFFNPDTTNVAGDRVANLIRVNNRRAAVPVIDMAVIKFSVEPSAVTINGLRDKLQEFIAANNNAKSFAENAQQAGYQAFPALVGVSTPQIAGLTDTRDVIYWAMDADKGDVSTIFGDESTTGRFVVAAVNDVFTDYRPATYGPVKQELTAKVRNDKKASEMIAQYQGKAKDISGYAAVMDAKVDTANVSFGQINIYSPGFAGAEVAARASVAAKGQLVGPMKGNTGVVVFEVVDVETEGRPYDYQENAILYSRTRGAQALFNNMNSVLRGNKKVKNNLNKFYYRHD